MVSKLTRDLKYSRRRAMSMDDNSDVIVIMSFICSGWLLCSLSLVLKRYTKEPQFGAIL